jgi:hypothetical protein
MTYEDTRELASQMYRKGKAEFFIKDILLKKGAELEHIQKVLEEMNAHKDQVAKADKKTAKVYFIIALTFALIVLSIPSFRNALVHSKRRKGNGFLILVAPFIPAGIYWMKSKYRLSKM